MRTTQSLGLTGVASGGDVLSRESATRFADQDAGDQNSASFSWARALSRGERWPRADHDNPERDDHERDNPERARVSWPVAQPITNLRRI